VYIDADDDTNIAEKDEDLDKMMMYIFGDIIAFMDAELFFNIDHVPSNMVEFACSTFYM
jgi:hypothetical protein